ncbi:MAG: hypothetical protein ACLFVJ_22660, partial [Persicimonas sp.]
DDVSLGAEHAASDAPVERVDLVFDGAPVGQIYVVTVLPAVLLNILQAHDYFGGAFETFGLLLCPSVSR